MKKENEKQGNDCKSEENEQVKYHHDEKRNTMRVKSAFYKAPVCRQTLFVYKVLGPAWW